MSYPSIKEIVNNQDIALETASKSRLEELLWEALGRDLPLGITFLGAQAEDVKNTGIRSLKTESPNSPLGKQLIRLLGTDIARHICEQKFGVAFGFYNCCSSVAAPTKELLDLSVLEQIKLQNGMLASADC